VRRAEPIAGLGGVLLLVSLFLPWYTIYPDLAVQGDSIAAHLSVFVEGDDVTGWQAFTIIDVLLAILAVLAILVPILSVATRGPAKAIGTAVIASATGWLAILLVGLRLLDPPGANSATDLRYGVWLALAGAIIAWVGSWLSMRDDSTPGAVVPDVPVRPIPA
jgi:hypothetical protein